MSDGIQEIKDALSQGLKDIKEKQGSLEVKYKEIDDHVKTIESEIESKGKESEDAKGHFQKLVAQVSEVEKSLDDLIEKHSTRDKAASVSKSIGQFAAECEKLSEYSGGNMTLTKQNMSLFKKDITNASGSGADLIVPDYRPTVDGKRLPVSIRDLLTVVSTSSETIVFARESSFTNNAGPQGTGSNAGVQGQPKPKSDMTWEKVTVPVELISHWFAASRQILNDVNGLRDKINTTGLYGVRFKEDAQLLKGDGTSGNLSGLITNATAYDTGLNVSGDTSIDKIRRAIYQAGLSGMPATGVVLNPEDWMNIELTKTDDNAYLFANPMNQTETRLWGRRVVESYNQDSGDFLVGSFALAATLYDREQATVRISESHGDFFIENMIAILIEERLALAVEREDAFIEGSL
ncbi:MAG: phage major capsid protein [Proteobacteria bacterium]|nr:MAG: phage major capsid protein [Pseudomonadota bacterium]